MTALEPSPTGMKSNEDHARDSAVEALNKLFYPDQKNKIDFNQEIQTKPDNTKVVK